MHKSSHFWMLWLIACMWKITWSYDKGILMPLVIVMNHTHHFPLERHAKIMLLDPNTCSVYIRGLRPTFFCTSVESVAKIWLFHCGKSNLSLRKSKQKAVITCGTIYCLPHHERRVYFHLFNLPVFFLSSHKYCWGAHWEIRVKEPRTYFLGVPVWWLTHPW